MCAARLGFDTLGVDIDPDSIRTARENAERNDVRARFELGSLDVAAGCYDLVVANLYAELLVEHKDALLACTARRLILTGILGERADLVRRAYAPLVPIEDRSIEDWTLLVYETA